MASPLPVLSAPVGGTLLVLLLPTWSCDARSGRVVRFGADLPVLGFTLITHAAQGSTRRKPSSQATKPRRGRNQWMRYCGSRRPSGRGGSEAGACWMEGLVVGEGGGDMRASCAMRFRSAKLLRES